MFNIMTHLECLGQRFPQQFVVLLGIVCQSMRCCKGRIKMLGLSRWRGKVEVVVVFEANNAN